jgi:hypothetical protein
VVGAANPDAVVELLLWGVVGVAGLVLLAVFAWWLRRRTVGSPQQSSEDLLDLETLERMREAGTLTAHEYKALRARAIQSLGASGDRGLQR